MNQGGGKHSKGTVKDSGDKVFKNRTLRIAFWNAEPKLVDSTLMTLERHLGLLGEVTLKEITSLDDPSLYPCDLLLIAAQSIHEDHFPEWLKGLQQRIKVQGHIWIPALIVSEVSFGALCTIFGEAVQQNWYFDVISASHLSSLPIRVATLLKIHDHLHELRRYEKALDALQNQVTKLETEVLTLKNKTS